MRLSKRKAGASVSSTQQSVEVTPTLPDLNLSPSKAVGSSSPSAQVPNGAAAKNGVAVPSVRVCSLPIPVASTPIIDGGIPSVNVKVPVPLVPSVSTTISVAGVPSATSGDVKVPAPVVPSASTTKTVAPPVPEASTTNGDALVPLAASVNVRAPLLQVPNASTAKHDAGAPLESSKASIISNGTARSANMIELPTQNQPVVSKVTSSGPSDAAAGPESQRSSNTGVMNQLPALSPSVVSAGSSSTSLTSTAAGPASQRSTNEQSSVSVVDVRKPAQNIDDPFSSMRLDIDRMSYEELLALQERIGYVSTGLSGKELVKARKITRHRVKRRKTTTDKEVDSKCSICQEEYQSGDKLGNLKKCKHKYHLNCIEQWLRQKNWCPTCKTDARAGL